MRYVVEIPGDNALSPRNYRVQICVFTSDRTTYVDVSYDRTSTDVAVVGRYGGMPLHMGIVSVHGSERFRPRYAHEDMPMKTCQ